MSGPVFGFDRPLKKLAAASHKKHDLLLQIDYPLSSRMEQCSEVLHIEIFGSVFKMTGYI